MTAALTTKNPSLRSILFERARIKSKRGERTDNFHLSLVIECGGMRSVAAGGAMRVLFDSQLFDCFDSIHGSSAGACAAAYFLAGQPEEGHKICHYDICTRRVVNPLRFLSQPCMVDTDYIVDEVIANKRQLNIDKIISEPGVLNIITTSVTDGLPIVHKNFTTKNQLLRALKATLRVPGPFEYGIEIDGRRHLDGGMVGPIPMFSAAASHATHILVVCTQRVQDYGAFSKLNLFEGMVIRLLYGRQLQQAYIAAQSSSQRTWRLDHQPSTTDILVRPEHSTYCSWATIDKYILERVENESARVAQAYLNGDV